MDKLVGTGMEAVTELTGNGEKQEKQDIKDKKKKYSMKNTDSGCSDCFSLLVFTSGLCG